MAIKAQFSALWDKLPHWFQCKEIPPTPPATDPSFKAFPQIPGMRIPVDWETCCIQMSCALNQVGLRINYFDKNRVIVDPQGNEYLLDVGEMRGYLNSKYGQAETVARVDANNKLLPRWLLQQSVLAGRQGIIGFGNRHIDLWNGTKIHGEGYILSALWEAESALTRGISFWEVNVDAPA